MVRYLLELLEMRRRILSSRRVLVHFTDRELEDVGLMRGDVACPASDEPWCSRPDKRRSSHSAGTQPTD